MIKEEMEKKYYKRFSIILNGVIKQLACVTVERHLTCLNNERGQ